MYIIYLAIALLAGVGLAAQAAINSQLAKSMGGEPFIAALISVLISTVFLLVISFFKTDLGSHFSNLLNVPIWKLLGGILGALFVFATILIAPKIGVTNMLFFIIIGQLTTAAIIDHFGLLQMPVREININKLLGLGLAVISLVIYLFGDKFLTLSK